MAELTRYRAWYRSRLFCKMTTVKFLVTLLILPIFPEPVYMIQQYHYRHHSFQRGQQSFVESRNILHPIFPINTIVPPIGALRNVAKAKGNNKIFTFKKKT